MYDLLKKCEERLNGITRSHKVNQGLFTLLVYLGMAAMSLFVEPVSAGSQAKKIWTTQDVIDNRISVDAQYSLIRMCRSQDNAKRADVTSMLSAILDDKTLAGIYQVNHQPPAMRAKALGMGWWNLIPKGKDSTCVKGMGGSGKSAPMIVYRKNIGPYKERVDQALKSAWRMCKDVYGLPDKAAIPCVIAVRPPTGGKSACDAEKRKLWEQAWWECYRKGLTLQAHKACLKVCSKPSGERGYVFLELDCVASHSAECGPTHRQGMLCDEYANKHVVCP